MTIFKNLTARLLLLAAVLIIFLSIAIAVNFQQNRAVPLAQSTTATNLDKSSKPQSQTAAVHAAAPTVEWFLSSIDPEPAAGLFSSSIIGPTGTQYVAYLDDKTDELKVAASSGQDWMVKSALGSSKNRDGWYPSLAFDQQGGLHMSVYADSKKQILYGTMSKNGKWSFETVVGKVAALDTTLIFNAENLPGIVYFDKTTGSIRYAVQRDHRWTASVISAADPKGAYYPAAMDDKNNVVVAFRGSSGGLYTARQAGDSWEVKAIDTEKGAGYYPSIAVDEHSGLHISYFDKEKQVLKYAYWNGSQWSTEVVDNAGKVGAYTSIAVDKAGGVHISYFDKGNRSLKYAFGRSRTWHIDTVDHSGNAGKYSSIVTDKDNNPHISYYDESSKTLWSAYADVYKVKKNAINRVSAFHRSGQTFITWFERSDIEGEQYKIYRSDEPMDHNNLSKANSIAQVGEGSATFWGNYYSDQGKWVVRFTKNLILKDGEKQLDKGTGALVWTVSKDDLNGLSEGAGYYAVTVIHDGTEELLGSVGPIQEVVADPLPVEITDLPGIAAKDGAHYYLQYMDLHNWNPTFHVPNSTNRYYGFDPSDPKIRNALAYTYDYSVFEPDPDIMQRASAR